MKTSSELRIPTYRPDCLLRICVTHCIELASVQSSCAGGGLAELSVYKNVLPSDSLNESLLQSGLALSWSGGMLRIWTEGTGPT